MASPLARDEFVAYLSAPSDKTRPCIRSTACTYVKAMGSSRVADALGPSTFDLGDVVAGAPLTVYLVIPPEKLASHRGLLRLWVGTLLTAVTRRRHIPRRRTLFLLDECPSWANSRRCTRRSRCFEGMVFRCGRSGRI